jgi:hypothetical protein
MKEPERLATGRTPDPLCGSSVQSAHRRIERLPEDTSLQRLEKIAAQMELLFAFILLDTLDSCKDDHPYTGSNRDGARP